MFLIIPNEIDEYVEDEFNYNEGKSQILEYIKNNNERVNIQFHEGYDDWEDIKTISNDEDDYDE